MTQRTPTLQMYRDARGFLTPHVDSAVTNQLCIICFKDRELDYSTEQNTRSHIITNSVLHAVGSDVNNARMELINSTVISFMDFSYKAFCKHRRDPNFCSCEDKLNILGEQALPSLMSHFVGNELSNPDPVGFNDPRYFHAITTIGWRVLALSLGCVDIADQQAAFRCLEYIRPFIRDESHDINDKFAVMLHVVGRETVSNWKALTGAVGIDEETSDAIEAPLITTICPGAKLVQFELSGVRFIHWNVILGPLHIKYVYLDISPIAMLKVGGTIEALENSGFQRISSSGQFTVEGYETRPALAQLLLQSDVLLPLARAYAIAFRSRQRHWLQQFSNIEILVPEDFGPFEEGVDTINVLVGPYRSLVCNCDVTAQRWNLRILKCRIYQNSRSMVLFAEFNALNKKILCACKIRRSETEKYDAVEALREAHADYLQPHAELLLAMLKHIDPLNDLQLPPPSQPSVSGIDLAAGLDEEDTFGSLFG